MIELRQVSKNFESQGQVVKALQNINLRVTRAQNFGIIGYSGAGKSTLIRCLNYLEIPTEGEVLINNLVLGQLNAKQLREARRKIGMIFQHFNLMKSRNVYENIAYPLKGQGLNRDEIKEKVDRLLKLVGLEEKVNVYPNQLSGGQKQRVAIARALANDPEVLLCDEATSALDPQTTKSILRLLKEINERLGITMVLITHQMEVVKDICHQVAVMEEGEIVEVGPIVDVFSNPKATITKDFVANVFQDERIFELLESRGSFEELTKLEKLVKISFVGQQTGKAFISNISKLFDIEASILFGSVEMIQKTPIGHLIVSLHGDEKLMSQALQYLNDNQIKVEVLSDGRVL